MHAILVPQFGPYCRYAKEPQLDSQTLHEIGSCGREVTDYVQRPMGPAFPVSHLAMTLCVVLGHPTQEGTARSLRLYFGLVNQQNWDVVAHGVNTAAGSTFHARSVVLQLQRFLARRADQNVEQIFRNHGQDSICSCTDGKIADEGAPSLRFCKGGLLEHISRWEIYLIPSFPPTKIDFLPPRD